jgi:hypothetical protein
LLSGLANFLWVSCFSPAACSAFPSLHTCRMFA